MKEEQPGFDFEAELLQFQLQEADVREYHQLIERYVSFLNARGVEFDYSPLIDDFEETQRKISYQLAAALAVLKLLFLESEVNQTRKRVEETLLLSKRYTEPWLSLVAEEFEGEGLTEKETAAILEQFRNDQHLVDRDETRLKEKTHMYCSFLIGNGYGVISDDDIIFCMHLASEKLIRELPIKLPSYHEDAIVLLLNTQRNHPAWRILVDSEF